MSVSGLARFQSWAKKKTPSRVAGTIDHQYQF